MRTVNKNLLAIASVLTMSAFSSAVSAACAVDLRGDWSFYSLASDTTYSNCNFTMDRDGNVEDGSECSVYNWDLGLAPDPETGLNVPVFTAIYDKYGLGEFQDLSGQYVVGADCSVSGIITIGVVNLQILDSKINNSRDAVRGIFYDDFFNQINQFEMFRVD